VNDPVRRGSSRRVLSAVVAGVLVVGAIAGLVAVLATVTGHGAIDALRALWNGSLGSRYAVFSATLIRATPLILTGLAVTLAFTAGVMNIGAEGQLLSGATAATIVCLATNGIGWLAIPLSLIAGALAGSVWAYVPALLRRRFGVLEVISTIMMNFVALYMVGYLVRGPLQEPLKIYPQSSTIPAPAQLPIIVPGTRLHLGFVVALVCAGALWWSLRWTAAGFRVRAIGSNPNAAHSAGQIDVGRTTMRAFMLSGGLAGMAGAIEVTGVTYSLYENLSPGYGYTAIAVALVGALHPGLTVLSGILFGALEAGASAMQRDAGIPSVLASVVEASIILLLLGVAALRLPVRRWIRLRLSQIERSDGRVGEAP
jgi:general nucleoside transport system permease protein